MSPTTAYALLQGVHDDGDGHHVRDARASCFLFHVRVSFSPNQFMIIRYPLLLFIHIIYCSQSAALVHL